VKGAEAMNVSQNPPEGELLVGDTGFEPVTSSVSGQNLSLGIHGSLASGACAGSLMFATVRAGWPTVWPTVLGVRHKPSCRRKPKLHPASAGISRRQGAASCS
jgi:hypothetical protein